MLDVEFIDIDSQLVGADRARARLDAIEAALADMHGPISQVIDDLHHQTDLQFSSLGVAAATPWDPLDPSTVADKTRMGYPTPDWPLVATGELRESALGDGPYDYGVTTEQEAIFGLDMPRNGYNIAALQQFGVPWREVHRRAYVTHDGRHVKAASYMWHLPSRPMIVSTEALAEEGLDRIATHLFYPLI
jgi:hypothetical protein